MESLFIHIPLNIILMNRKIGDPGVAEVYPYSLEKGYVLLCEKILMYLTKTWKVYLLNW